VHVQDDGSALRQDGSGDSEAGGRRFAEAAAGAGRARPRPRAREKGSAACAIIFDNISAETVATTCHAASTTANKIKATLATRCRTIMSADHVEINWR
jgi:hypothetical protein